MKIDKADLIYKKYYNQHYRAFILSEAKELTLQAPAPTSTPWNALSSSKDLFTKETCFPDPSKGKVHFIKKNAKNHAVLWETKAETLKAGVRWGLVKAESITGQVISTLGHYRIIAHARIVEENKLMVSNTQAVKLALLDVYQDRFEFLQNLESLVNTHATKASFDAEIRRYKEKLEAYKKTIPEKFRGLHLEEEGEDAHGPYKGMNYGALTSKIIEDLDKDITLAEDYRTQLENQESSAKANRARGYYSILDFVKRQMHKNLYEFQGLNQDVVFAIGALSRGEMNDCIEDARDLIDKHKPDLRNAVTEKHHGLYGHPDETIVYDFAKDELSPAEERRALMFISFIEGWDVVDYTT
ncbi:MAG: hypothetical protein H0U73_06735, partial [Tatlockia sp.]|nr:hypothetical protein [Tatlockia sp.]